MKLYHGSTVVVKTPALRIPVRALDFGAGFYTTSSEEQAIRWAQLQQRRRRSGEALVSSYEFDEDSARKRLTLLEFGSPNGDWLDFVVANRKGSPASSEYDMVIGPVANDNTMTVINDYMDGRYTKKEAIDRLLPQRLMDQYAFLTERSLEFLMFLGVK